MAKKELGTNNDEVVLKETAHKSNPRIASMKVGVLGDAESFAESKGSTEYYQGLAHSEDLVPEAMSNPAEVISRLDHPVTISYNGLSMIVPPRGRNLVADAAKLGACPRGTTVVPKPDLRKV